MGRRLNPAEMVDLKVPFLLEEEHKQREDKELLGEFQVLLDKVEMLIKKTEQQVEAVGSAEAAAEQI